MEHGVQSNDNHKNFHRGFNSMFFFIEISREVHVEKWLKYQNASL